MSELNCTLWVYVTRNLPGMGNKCVVNCEASFFSNVDAAVKEGNFSTFSKEPLANILACVRSKQTQSLFPTLQRPFMKYPPQCCSRQTRTLLTSSLCALCRDKFSFTSPFYVVCSRRAKSSGLTNAMMKYRGPSVGSQLHVEDAFAGTTL